MLLPADGAREQILGIQLACDLLRGLSRPSVLVRAGPGNDGKARSELETLYAELRGERERQAGARRLSS
jgi:hypothetical protein